LKTKFISTSENNNSNSTNTLLVDDCDEQHMNEVFNKLINMENVSTVIVFKGDEFIKAASKKDLAAINECMKKVT